MLKKPFLFVFCATFFLAFGCVPELQYVEPQEDLNTFQDQLDEQNKKLNTIRSQLLNSEKMRNECSRSLSDLRSRNENLRIQNIRLQKKIEKLETVIWMRHPKSGYELNW